MAGPTRLELATSCVTDKKHAGVKPRCSNRLYQKTGLSSTNRLCLAVAGCGRMHVGSLHFPLQSPSLILRRQWSIWGCVRILFTVSLLRFSCLAISRWDSPAMRLTVTRSSRCTGIRERFGVPLCTKFWRGFLTIESRSKVLIARRRRLGAAVHC